MSYRVALLLLLLVLLGLLWWLAYDHFRLENLVEQEQRLNELVRRYPMTSLAGAFLLYTLLSLVPGTTGKAIIYGWLFGFWRALVLVNLALTAAALIAFLAVRYIFHEWVHQRFALVTRRVDQALQHEGASFLLFLRLVHAPFTVVNYAAGTTDVRARTFWWTTHLGMLPGNIAFVLAGSQLPTLEQMSRQGLWSLINVPLLVGLSVVALLPIGVRWLVRRMRSDQDVTQEEHNPSLTAPQQRTWR